MKGISFSTPMILALLNTKPGKRFKPKKTENYLDSEYLFKRLIYSVSGVDENGCWNWGRCLNNMGYPKINVGGKIIYAHRLIFSIVHDIAYSQELLVCHHCDNPKCINPGHLFLGTQTDNMQDCKAKGRLNPYPLPPRPGSLNPRAKLTNDQAEMIKTAHGTYREIATRFGITASAVSAIKRGKTWVTK